MRRRLILVLALLCAVAPRPARALSAEELNIYSPAVAGHERELEARTFAAGKGADREQGYDFSAGYAPTDFWETEFYEVLHRAPGMPLAAASVVWENRFQLADTGRYWLDPGVIVEAELPQQAGNPNEFQLTPLLEKQVGADVFTLNAPLEWQSGPGFTGGTDVLYAARVERLMNPYASPAVEFFGEPGVVGNWRRASRQNHQAGPAVYGTLRGDSRRALNYSAAALFGLTPAASDWTLVTRLELEF